MKNTLKTFQKVLTFLDVIKNICGSWKGVTVSTLIGLLEEVDFGIGFWASEGGCIWGVQVEEVTATMVEIAKELKWKMEPKGVTELLQSHDKTNRGRVASYGWAKKVISWDTPTEDNMKIVKVTAKDLEYYINFIDKEGTGFERIDLFLFYLLFEIYLFI